MNVLYNNMSLPYLIEWACIRSVKQVTRKKKIPDSERIREMWKNIEIVLCLIIKFGKRIILK